MHTVTSECDGDDVRLVDGASSAIANGRLEVCNLGTWGTVCSDRFTVTDASVGCRWLGFGMCTNTS